MNIWKTLEVFKLFYDFDFLHLNGSLEAKPFLFRIIKNASLNLEAQSSSERSPLSIAFESFKF